MIFAQYAKVSGTSFNLNDFLQNLQKLILPLDKVMRCKVSDS